MYYDSTFFNKLSELHKEKFDWKSNNCGLFVARVFNYIHHKDYESIFSGEYHDELSAFKYVKSKGGWDSILKSCGLKEREDSKILIGDVVLCENAIGIFDGTNGLFAGGAIRRRNKLTHAYYL
jgi:hypothetical protein